MNLLAIIFFIFGLFSLAYAAAIVSYSGIGTAFLWFWVAVGLACMVISSILRFIYSYRIEIGKPVKFIFSFVLIIGITAFVLIEGFIIYKGNQQPEPGADYVIVLGAQVRGTALSRALKNRLDTAYEYLKDNESTMIIVSGGQGSGEEISEAEAMEQYFISKGIKPERIIKEDQSTSTYENLLFSKELMKEGNYTTVIVTNRFHIFRAAGIAEKLGIKDVKGLGAPNDDILTLSYYVREFLAVVKDKLLGNI